MDLLQEISLVKLTSAINFAAEKHKDQKRNGSGEPYINHCLAVMNYVAVYSTNNRSILAAAVLHDTVEDTDANLEEIATHFGSDVAKMVDILTDRPADSKTIRRNEQIQRLKNCGMTYVCDIKVADKLSNCKDLMDKPSGWSENSIKAYFEFSKRLVEEVDAHYQISNAFTTLYDLFTARNS